MPEIKTFSGEVIGFKVNPKNDDQYITKVELGIDNEGFSIAKDCFTSKKKVSSIVPVTDEVSGEEVDQLIPWVHKEMYVVVSIKAHEKGEVYEKDIKKGDNYVNEEGITVTAGKAGKVLHSARSNGFTVLSIEPRSYESQNRSKQMYGRN